MSLPVAIRLCGLVLVLACAFMSAAGAVPSDPASSMAVPPAPNYARPGAWACRPGAEGACTTGIGAILLRPDGTTGADMPETVAAASPATDCFYVYPTASRAAQDYADAASAPDIMAVVRAQAGRLAAHCRLFVPFYRQATLQHLRLHPGGSWDGPYQDILAAWRFYLAHDNDGRGVVLVGHSQGTIILQRLIASEIDGTASQRLLVAAFLIGDPGLLVPPGRDVGGSFAHVPLCRGASATGCAYVWSSYAADDARAPRAFGRDRDGLDAACTDPAASDGGLLDSFLPAAELPIVPASSAPFVEIVGGFSASCRADAEGSVLRIAVVPGPNAAALRPVLDGPPRMRRGKDWGLHPLDLALALGNVLRLIDAETASWRAAHR